MEDNFTLCQGEKFTTAETCPQVKLKHSANSTIIIKKVYEIIGAEIFSFFFYTFWRFNIVARVFVTITINYSFTEYTFK